MKIEKELLEHFNDNLEEILEQCNDIYITRLQKTRSSRKADSSVKAFLLKEIVKKETEYDEIKNSERADTLYESVGGFLIKLDRKKIPLDSKYIYNGKIKNIQDNIIKESVEEIIKSNFLNINDFKYVAVAENNNEETY